MIRQPLTVANGLLPQSPFDIVAQANPGISPPQDMAPFTWGAGGSKLTADQLAAKQTIAQQLMKSNYSPIGSVWEGLGRVADNVTGALDSRALDKEAQAQAASRDQIAQALLGGNNGAAGAAILSGEPGLGKLGELAWAQANPKPVNNDTVNDYNFFSQQLGPQAGQQYLQNQIDPVVTIPLPGGQTYVGPRSGLQSIMGGGGPPSTTGAGVPTAPVGKLTPIGGPTQPASGSFP